MIIEICLNAFYFVIILRMRWSYRQYCAQANNCHYVENKTSGFPLSSEEKIEDNKYICSHITPSLYSSFCPIYDPMNK